MISVIIPVYNVEKYLRQCLDSVLAQTYQDFEIICVNDGSTDNSQKILEEYAKKDSRFTILNRENGGAGLARNSGLDVAKGKYVQFLDSDDWFEPEMFETMFNTAEKFNADIVACSSRKINDAGEITETKNPNFPINLDKAPINRPFNYKTEPDDFFSLSGVIVWNKLYSRDLIEKNNLRYHQLIGPEDVCFICMAGVCAERIVILDNEFVNYRFNRPKSVQTYRANHAIDIVMAGLYVKEFLEKRALWDILKKSFFNTFISATRWEIVLCNDEQYTKFLTKLKTIKDWEIFKPALREKTVTVEDLYSAVGEKKVMLWGASYYLQKILAQEKTKNTNILGIIDRNEASWGKKLGYYTIYPPEKIDELKPEGILLTVHNNNETIYPAIKKEIEEHHRNVKMLPNIFN